VNLTIDAPNGFTVTGETMIGKLRCVVYLSDTLETQVSIDSSSFTSADSRCATFLQSVSIATIQLAGCGYSTLSQYIRTRNIANFSAAPNPFRNEISVAAKLLAPTMLRLDIYNDIGSKIYSNDIGFIQAGTDAGGQVSTKDWPSGVYYARLSTSDGEVRTVKLVKE
jgi:hypothetical protein